MPPELRFGPFRLHRANQSLWRDSAEIALTPKAFAVLLHIADRAGSLVTKHELLDAVWGDTHVTDGVLKRCVAEIRKALQDPADEPRYIQTLHGRGYRFLLASDPGADLQPTAGRPALMVGRQRELEILDVSFGNVVEGIRQIVFITGEAGLGKTTLVDNWVRALNSRYAGPGQPAVGRGRCLQQFGSGEPYLPVFEALEHLSRSLGPGLASMLRMHAPTWLLHMPSLISLQDRVTLRDEIFGTSRERMLREITDAFEALSAVNPVILILEDLHWSDPSTIDLLTSIATRTSPARLMILSTYRPSELGGSGNRLSQAQNELEIHGQCLLLPLSYLTEGDIRDYLAWRFSQSDFQAPLIGSLHRRTSGNPLFVSCVVDELERSGSIELSPEAIRAVVPNTLQSMFERQYNHLTEWEQEILAIAAAEGEIFSTASIAAALGREAEVEAACEGLAKRQAFLKRAESIQFPDGAQSPRYSFLHVLCRDALYRGLPPTRRSHLHALLGRANEQLYASDPSRVATELAGHYELGGELNQAIKFLRLAADGAAARFANREAAFHLERAIQLLDRAGQTGEGSLRMDLLEQRGFMRLSTMDLAGSAADFAAVEAQARLTGNVNRRVKALLDSIMPWAFLDYERGLAAIEEACQLKSGADPILSSLADAYRSGVRTYFFGWHSDLEEVMNTALATLRPVNDPGVRFRFLWMEAFVRNGASDYPACCRAAAEARQLARRAGVFHQYFVGTHNLVMGLTQRGNLGEAIRTAKEATALATTNHHALERFWFESLQALVAIEAFDFGSAQPICERLAREPVVTSYNLTPHVLLWLGLARLGAGSFAAAREAFDRLETAVEGGGVGFEYRFPLIQGQAQCALAGGDRAQAKHLATCSIQLAEKHRAGSYAARGYRLLSEIASQEGDLSTAVQYISAAIAALNGCEALNVEWQVYATAARALAALGCGEESAAAREHALELGERVAATLAEEPSLRECLMVRLRSQLAVDSSVTP